MFRFLTAGVAVASIAGCTKANDEAATASLTTSPTPAEIADGPKSNYMAYQIGDDDGTKLCLAVQEPQGSRIWVADVDALFRATQEGQSSWDALVALTGRSSAADADVHVTLNAGFGAALGLVKESGQLESQDGPCTRAAVAARQEPQPTPTETATATPASTSEPDATSPDPAATPTVAAISLAASEKTCREVILNSDAKEARQIWIKYTLASGEVRSMKVRAEAEAKGMRIGWHTYDSWTCEGGKSSCNVATGFVPLCVEKAEVATRPWATWQGGWSPAETVQGKVPYASATVEKLEIGVR